MRLPTGDKENLLGTGAVQTKLLLIASGEIARFAPHVNFGYTFSHGGLSSSLTTLPTSNLPANAPTQTQINNETGISLVDPHLPDEINYVAGVDIAAHWSRFLRTWSGERCVTVSASRCSHRRTNTVRQTALHS